MREHERLERARRSSHRVVGAGAFDDVEHLDALDTIGIAMRSRDHHGTARARGDDGRRAIDPSGRAEKRDS